MDEKMTEILNDLNEFHNNIVNLNNINDSFKQYIEAIAKEKENFWPPNLKYVTIKAIPIKA